MLRLPWSALLRAPRLGAAGPAGLPQRIAPTITRLNSSSSTTSPFNSNDVADSPTKSEAAQPTSTASQPSTEQPVGAEPTTELSKRKLTIAEQDALAFKQLDDREGSGAGNEILDGEYEKGMTRNTRKNQYRVI